MQSGDDTTLTIQFKMPPQMMKTPQQILIKWDGLGNAVAEQVLGKFFCSNTLSKVSN